MALGSPGPGLSSLETWAASPLPGGREGGRSLGHSRLALTAQTGVTVGQRAQTSRRASGGSPRGHGEQFPRGPGPASPTLSAAQEKPRGMSTAMTTPAPPAEASLPAAPPQLLLLPTPARVPYCPSQHGIHVPLAAFSTSHLLPREALRDHQAGSELLLGPWSLCLLLCGTRRSPYRAGGHPIRIRAEQAWGWAWSPWRSSALPGAGSAWPL